MNARSTFEIRLGAVMPCAGIANTAALGPAGRYWSRWTPEFDTKRRKCAGAMAKRLLGLRGQPSTHARLAGRAEHGEVLRTLAHKDRWVTPRFAAETAHGGPRRRHTPLP